MTFVVAVVSEAAALARQRADELCVLDAGVLQLAPEESAPATLESRISMVSRSRRSHVVCTGLPVMESPRAMIRTGV